MSKICCIKEEGCLPYVKGDTGYQIILHLYDSDKQIYNLEAGEVDIIFKNENGETFTRAMVADGTNQVTYTITWSDGNTDIFLISGDWEYRIVTTPGQGTGTGTGGTSISSNWEYFPVID